ncbi:MAG: CoA ester lyase [Anaerolineales bacterium]|nr:CoA ester lyase [Anaerolineales bacterium]
MHARRALLYMPGDDMRKIQKATTLGVDCICMDMEDGVALNRKAEARQTIAQALQSLNFGVAERLARINAIGSGFESDDLAVVLPARPDGIVIPKVEHAEQIQWVSQMIAGYEELYGWPKESICLLAVVESARGVVNLPQIASADPRMQAIIFGAEDFAGDIGATRTPEGWEVFYARSAVVTYAAAYDLQAIDMVYIDFQDIEGLRREAEQGARMAFSGKQIIHPNQVAPVQEAFTPSDEAIAYALRVQQAFEKHQKAGKGAFALDGKMIDAPIMKSAQRVLALARAAGKI